MWRLKPPTVERTSRVLAILAAGFGLVLLVELLPALIRLATESPQSDLSAYYLAGDRLNHGEPLYPTSTAVNDSSFYRYPPLLAIAFRPLALLPLPVVAAGWAVANVVFLLLTVQQLGLRPRTALGLAALSFPIAWSLVLGQAQVVVTLLLVIARPWSVALAGHLKVFPVLAAIYWVGRRDWTSLRSFLAWFAVMALIQLAVEPRGSLAFLGTLSLAQVGGIDNLSPYQISLAAWVAFVAALVVLAFGLARTRFGWAAAILLVTVSTPRLISYWLMSLLAVLRRDPGPEPTKAKEVSVP